MRRDLESTPLHRSLLTPVLILGVERDVVAALFGAAAILVLAPRLNPVTPVLAALLLAVGLPFLRRLARRDPWLFRLVSRHARVTGFYPAQAAPTVRRLSWPPTL